MDYRFGVNALSHCVTLLGNNIGKENIYEIEWFYCLIPKHVTTWRCLIPPIQAHACKLLYSVHENESIYHYDNDIVVEFSSAESFHLELYNNGNLFFFFDGAFVIFVQFLLFLKRKYIGKTNLRIKCIWSEQYSCLFFF